MKQIKKELNIFDKHQLKIAKNTLKLSDIGAKIMGGMTREEAKEVIKRLEGGRSDEAD
jgi:hypothetical protein